MSSSQIDEHGYRLNIGIVLINTQKQVFWAERQDCPDAWQFPQGGVDNGETILQALYRELYEEVGLNKKDVKLIAESADWHCYQLPEKFRHKLSAKVIGQKQRWFLLELITDEKNIALDRDGHQEFRSWQWVDYWYPLEAIIKFKRQVYHDVLHEFVGYI